MRCQFVASEKHNFHDDLCLIDPPVISFDRESQSNILLHGSDEFNDKINSFPYYTKQGRYRGHRGGAWPLNFLKKNKKGKHRQK